jgi:hypothetical protein
MGKECWGMMNLKHIRAELEQCRSGKETVMKILRLEQKDQNRAFIWLWCWWSARNKATVGEWMATAAEISNFVSFHLMKFKRMVNMCIAKLNHYKKTGDFRPSEVTAKPSEICSSGQSRRKFETSDSLAPKPSEVY